MIIWTDRSSSEPSKDGKYLVLCASGNFDSRWVSFAYYKQGKFQPDFGDTYVTDDRVTHWCDINEADKPVERTDN